ncbi:latent-transforming growth factor beta-binding protein 1 [Nematolebias whitei]|uniref:latent-transforming growth factor beta-binding protein 1 n=1 Tax=Nematolebias whitei TaxID=451745 RepID=UPI001899ABFE|nr:latent-transforming growth factor beta-binding protein 1 [Nematolebias whitei]
MRICLLWISWTLWFCSGALQHPQREEGDLEPGGRREEVRFRPGRLAALLGPGDRVKFGTRRAAHSGPGVCGDRCCVQRTLSPGPGETRRSSKPRCSHADRCPLTNRCVCRQRFHGNRCMKLPVGERRATAPPVVTALPPSSTTTTEPVKTCIRPEPAESDPNPSSIEDKDLMITDSGTVKSENPEAETENIKLNRGVSMKENRASLEHLGVTSTDSDMEEQRTASEHVILDPDPGSKRENKTRSIPESLKLNLGLKEDERWTSGTRTWEKKKNQILSLREAQSVLLRKTSSLGGRGVSIAAFLMKHILREKRKLHILTSSSSPLLIKFSLKTFHTRRGQGPVQLAARTANGQTGGRGTERFQVTFTPTICKVLCSQDRCVNHCERGNVTTLYSEGGGGGGGRRDSAHGPGFRVFLCPLLCKNGGVCLQKDRCFCPKNFTGKFCQIPASPSASSNQISRPALLATAAANQELMRSEFLLPLGQNQEALQESSSPMVKVRVQHPPEASVKIHQVMKVSGSGPALQTSSSSSSGSAGAPAPSPVLAGGGVQAQILSGVSTYNHQSGFRYCFREVKDGQCSSPLPGLRSRETCCRGTGKAWGLTDCVLCPENSGQTNGSCPVGFERSNGSQCVDVNECHQQGLCENGLCVNTRGSFSCVCRLGFILDATHGICISHSVISEEKGQCYRILGSGLGPSSCSMPIFRNITKQICCCSRVGKAWGPECQKCPYFGSAAFKEICPAGPGYHYSASTLQFTQRADPAGRGPLLTSQDSRDSEPGSSSTRTSSSQQKLSPGSSAGTRPAQPKPEVRLPSQPPLSSSRTFQPSGSTISTSHQNRVDSAQTNSRSTDSRGAPTSSGSRSDPVAPRGDSASAPAQRGSRPDLARPHVSPTTRPTRVQVVQGVCESRPGVCGRGLCVDLPRGNHTCKCDQGFQLNTQRQHCHDIDECQQNPCSNARCENTPGSYRCVCRHGYRLIGNTCSDVDECVDSLQCPGQECINTQGSFRCESCQPGFGLLNRLCTDIDECRRSPCPNGRCENTPGSYRCVCRHGYKLQNNTCTDVDECAEPSQCPGQMCVNSVGSYSCVSCRPGYTLTNRQCTDVDECVNIGACEADQVCVNTVGSFRCDCGPGYRRSGLGRQCRDVNECLEGDFCFSRGECVNTPGSYMCVCSPGFTLSDNRTACLDVDECVRSGVCSDGRCVNTEGSFQCECRSGFASNPEKNACLDVDECVSSSGSVCGSQRCENTIGSYRCLVSCEPGYQVSADGRCVGEPEPLNVTADHDSPFLFVSPQTETLPGSPHTSFSSSGSSTSSFTSSSFLVSMVDVAPVLPPLPVARPGEVRECYYNLADQGTCSLLATNTSQQECCCTVGEGWGLGCQYNTCPPVDTAEFLSLCPSGRGYITAGPGAFSYRDVDECKRFHPEVCKNGVCVNNIPGYSCYCSSGYVYNSMMLECVDHDECEEESCVGGLCVNTVGSYYCSCLPPLVLDDTQRNCVNASHLTIDENLSVCWQHVTADLLCQSPLLGAQVTFIDCCCFYGEGWGMGCALCPATDSEDYASLCSSFSAPVFPERFPESAGSETGAGHGGASPPYSRDFLPPELAPSRDFGRPDYDDYSPAGGSRSSFRGRTGLPDETYQGPEFSTSYYSEGDYGSPDSSHRRPPSFGLPPDSRSELGFGTRSDLPALNLAPLPGSPYEVQEEEEEEERTWRPGPRFPSFTDRSRGGAGGGGAPRRVYERRYDTYAGLNAAEDCGILHGCENGRCIRVSEGYTCDCYQGYVLDTTSMTCVDLNECEDSVGLQFPCVNARCVNTEGSFRCVCRRGYVTSRRPNHCVAV